jgi:antitoxin component YwqK of YwqJK toxin-antitoxin module
MEKSLRKRNLALDEYFQKIGHLDIQSSIKSTLESILTSVCDNFSIVVRLLSLFGSRSIVGHQFLQELEDRGKISEIYNFFEMWVKRTVDLNESFTSNFFNEFTSIQTPNVPIDFSLKNLQKEGIPGLNKLYTLNHPSTTPNRSRTDFLIQDILKIKDFDLKNFQPPAHISKHLKKFLQKFESSRAASKNFVRVLTQTGNLLYEGEINSEKQLFEGYGRLYHFNGQISKQGQFLNGTFNGQYCTEFDTLGNPTFSGTFQDGQRHGLGLEYSPDHVLVKKGEFLDFKLSGNNSTLYYEFGNIMYKGEMKDDKFSGKGTLYHDTGIKKYSGTFLDGFFNGKDCRLYS